MAWFSLMDMAIVGVPAIAFGIWQLVSVNREIAKDKREAAERGSPDGASPKGSGHPVGEHRLDNR